MKILICGDSFCVADDRYPGLHWSEKLLSLSDRVEVVNMAYGGCSNALIALQLLQALQLNPDFVILSFTSPGRYEYDKHTDVLPTEITGPELAHFIKQRYSTNMYDNKFNELTDRWRITASSDNFEKIKNFFYIDYCLLTLHSRAIKFCYSLGGFEYLQDHKQLINSNLMTNTLNQYSQFELPINLWYHQDQGKNQPFFHVSKDEVQMFFANECYRRAQGE